MSWVYDYEVAVPSFESRHGKLYFNVQMSRRTGTITTSSWRLEEQEQEKQMIFIFRSYSQFRKLWRQLSKMTQFHVEKKSSLSSLNASTNTIRSHRSRCSTNTTYTTNTPGSPVVVRPSRNPAHSTTISNNTNNSRLMNRSSTSSFRQRMKKALIGEKDLKRRGRRRRVCAPCICNAQACPFQSLNGILKNYQFPSKHRFKRKNKQLLDTRRIALEKFLHQIREYLMTFPRSLLHSIDVHEKCGVLGLFGTFIGYTNEIRSRAISRSPLACSGWRADVFSSSSSFSSPLTTPRHLTATTTISTTSTTVATTTPPSSINTRTLLGREQYITSSYESTEVVEEFNERLSDPGQADVMTMAYGLSEEEEEESKDHFDALSDEEDIPILASDLSDEEDEEEEEQQQNTTGRSNSTQPYNYLIGLISNQLEQDVILLKDISKSPIATTTATTSTTTTTLLPKLHIKSATTIYSGGSTGGSTGGTIGGSISDVRCLVTECRNHLLQRYGNDIVEFQQQLQQQQQQQQEEEEEITSLEEKDARLWELGLYIACHIGHKYAVESFLSRGISANATLEDGTSCLHAACRSGHVEIIQILIQHNADVNLRNAFGLTPLIMAISNRHARIVQVLLEVGGANANLGTFKDITPLHIAVAVQCLDIVQCLIQHQAHVQVANVSGTTPLHVAAKVGSYHICEVLLKNGANVSYQNESGQDACMIATENGHFIITQLCVTYQQRGSRTSFSSSSSYHKSSRTSSFIVRQRRSSSNSQAKSMPMLD
jgi:ankyrin repeat protein